MGSPTAPDSGEQFDVLGRRRICALLDAISGYAVNEVELYVACSC